MTPASSSAESTAFWTRRNVLVTGGTGMLGSWLCLRLAELGANVVAIVRDHVPHSNLWRQPAAHQITVVNGSLVDYAVSQRVLAEYEVDTVFHLAAQTIVPIANRSPLSTFESNIRGTWHLLEAARTTPGVRAMVVASSDKAYGDTPDLPYRETHRLEGKTPYDVSKVCTDLLSQTYHQHYGLPVCIVRCGNIFGGGDLNWNRLIPGTIRACHFGEPVLIRSDGSLVRDYIYVRDVVESYLAIGAAIDLPAVRGQAFNVSNETKLTVNEVAQRICTALHQPYTPQVLGGAQDEIQAQYLDSQKIRDLVRWKPQWTFDSALAETIGWYQDFFSRPGAAVLGLPAGAGALTKA